MNASNLPGEIFRARIFNLVSNIGLLAFTFEAPVSTTVPGFLRFCVVLTSALCWCVCVCISFWADVLLGGTATCIERVKVCLWS